MAKRKLIVKKPTLEQVHQFAGTPPEGPQGDKSPKGGAGKGKAEKTAPESPQNQSGNVPAGDVRLSANIDQDLHLKLKIAAAKERTTIGELLERLIAEHLH